MKKRPFPNASIINLQAPKSDGIAAKIITLVAEQTGYPEDMLDLDLDLEADLGIDTVKQAETFAAIRDEFDIPARDDLNLRSYNTLEKVIGFVEEMRPDLAKTEDQGLKIAETAVSQSSISNLQSPKSLQTASRLKSSRWSPNKLAIPKICWTWT